MFKLIQYSIENNTGRIISHDSLGNIMKNLFKVRKQLYQIKPYVYLYSSGKGYLLYVTINEENIVSRCQTLIDSVY